MSAAIFSPFSTQSRWSDVSVFKRNFRGEFIPDAEIPRKYLYTMEISTGDLYGIDNESKIEIAFKSGQIFFAAPLYSLGVLACNLAKAMIHLKEPSFSQIIQDIWRIVRIPIFAIGIMMAALYGVVSPYEGRKWIGKIEFAWHDGSSYRMDWRHARSEELFQFERDAKEIKAGKFHFLAYCMQKRGNIYDQVGDSPRFVKA